MQKELKFYDTIAGNTFDNDPYYASDLLTTPTQGTGAQNRIGRRFGIKSVEVKGNIQMPIYVQSAALYNLQDFDLWIYMVLDTQVNKSTSTYGQVRVASTELHEDFVNMENTDRYKTLQSRHIRYRQPNRPMDLSAAQNPTANTEGLGNGSIPFTMYKAFKRPLEVMCEPSNVGAGAAATMNNGVFLIAKFLPVINSVNASVAFVPALRWQGRCRFCC